MYKEFKHIGKKLFQSGMNNSHSGNISIRKGNKISITRTGSMLDELDKADVVSVDLKVDPNKDKKASMELLVHRAIYMTDKNVKAVVHAHCPYSIVMADGKETIVPYDEEGKFFLKSINVVNVENAIASGEVAAEISAYVLSNHCAVIARHGVFAWGKDIEEAYHYLTVCESVCRINYLMESKHVS